MCRHNYQMVPHSDEVEKWRKEASKELHTYKIISYTLTTVHECTKCNKSIKYHETHTMI